MVPSTLISHGLIFPSWWNVRQKAAVATLCLLSGMICEREEGTSGHRFGPKFSRLSPLPANLSYSSCEIGCELSRFVVHSAGCSVHQSRLRLNETFYRLNLSWLRRLSPSSFKTVASGTKYGYFWGGGGGRKYLWEIGIGRWGGGRAERGYEYKGHWQDTRRLRFSPLLHY